MAFQYPADPDDGDIIVRGDLLATYTKSTDTWTVGQLNPVAGIPGPAGPAGPTGAPGAQGNGFEVDGSVPTKAQLPSANLVSYNDIYITEDDGHGWIWTDRGWIDLGVVLRGPMGPSATITVGTTETLEPNEDATVDNSGTDTAAILDFGIPKGDKGEKGGQGDRGLKGDKGDPGPEGTLKMASEETLGGIRIGRGLKIDDKGVVATGITDVTIETVPIPSGDKDGQKWSETRTFQPIYIDIGDRSRSHSRTTEGSDMNLWTDELSISMPPLANGAMFYWWVACKFKPDPNRPGVNGDILPYRCYVEHKLEIQDTDDAEFSSEQDEMNTWTLHNITLKQWEGGAGINNRSSNIPRTKIDECLFTQGATIKFKQVISILDMSWGTLEGGNTRLIVVPFIDADGQEDDDDDDAETLSTHGPTRLQQRLQKRRESREHFGFSLHEEIGTFSDDGPVTPIDAQIYASADLKGAINSGIAMCDGYRLTEGANPDVVTALDGYRLELIGLRDFPGSIDAVTGECQRIMTAINEITAYNFRFETGV